MRFDTGFPALAALSIGLVATAPALAQRDFSDVEITTTEVADGVYMLTGAGGNIGVSAGPDGIILVDDQYAPLTEKILAALAKIPGGPVRFALNTHWHGDHVGGNEQLGKAGTVIVAHDNVRLRLSTDQRTEAYDADVPASPKDALPVVTFNEAVTFHFNGEEIHAFHVAPAHTDGDSVVHFRNANVVHAGDVYWTMYPFVDSSSGGSMDGMIDAIDRILELVDADTKIIPGHGRLSNAEEMRSYREMLATVRDRVAGMIDAGKTVEDVLAAKPTAEFDDRWGQGFMRPERWLSIVYDNLKKQATAATR